MTQTYNRKEITIESMTKDGNLLHATEEYIAHQCNCVSVHPHGLSHMIAKQFPTANIYGQRALRTSSVTGKPVKNYARPEDIGTPGTIVVSNVNSDSNSGIKGVIAMLAQYSMGRPHEWSNIEGIADYVSDRTRYFKMCLDEIAKLDINSLAFPYNIGCGLAGGNWYTYQSMILDFARANPHIEVVLYRM